MNCKRARRFLSDYLDEQVNAELKSELQDHLAQCKKCSELLKELRETNEIVKLKTAEHPPEEYWDSYWSRLRKRLEVTEAKPVFGVTQENLRAAPVFLPRLVLAVSCGLAVLLIVAVSLLYRNSREIRLLRHAAVEVRGMGGKARIPSGVLLVSEASVNSQARLFTQIREVFPRNTQWVVSNNGKVDMGIASYPLSENVATPGESPIFVAFSVVRTGEPPAEPVSSPKMMVLDGQEVNAKLDGLRGGDKTVYRYYCLPRLQPDGKMEIAVRVSLDSSMLQTAVLVREGEPVELGRLRKGDVEYVIRLCARSRDLPIRRIAEGT